MMVKQPDSYSSKARKCTSFVMGIPEVEIDDKLKKHTSHKKIKKTTLNNHRPSGVFERDRLVKKATLNDQVICLGRV